MNQDLTKVDINVDNYLKVYSSVNSMSSWEQKKKAMTELKSLDLPLYYIVLGLLYDIAVYPVTGEGVTEDALRHEIGKFFASYNASDFLDAPVLPLALTFDKAYELACDLLGLEKLFERECEAGRALPRKCFKGAIPSFEEQLARVVVQTREHERMTPTELGLKGSEEYGEFAQAVLVETGGITHKTLKEPSFGEAADVILCMMSSLAKLYDTMSPEEVSAELAKWLYMKQAKYDVLLQGKGPLKETSS